VRWFLRATPNEALGILTFLVRDQGVGGSNPLSPTNRSRFLNCLRCLCSFSFFGSIRYSFELFALFTISLFNSLGN
jgi:hypothetical protein